MPELPPVPKVIKITLQYHISNDLTAINRIHMKYPNTAPDNTAMTTFAGTVATQWASQMAASTHTSISLVGVTCIDLSDPSGAIGVNAGVHAGSLAGTALPAGTCALVNYTIQRRYRGGKPRTYLPVGSSNDVLDGQKWTTAFRSSVESAWNAFIFNVGSSPPANAGNLSLVQVSYYHKFKVHEGSTGRMSNIPLLREGGPMVDPVISVSVDPEYGSQRRRNRP